MQRKFADEAPERAARYIVANTDSMLTGRWLPRGACRTGCRRPRRATRSSPISAPVLAVDTEVSLETRHDADERSSVRIAGGHPGGALLAGRRRSGQGSR